MKVLRGLAWLLVFQCLGEALSRTGRLPVPGPVIGLLLMFAGLFLPVVCEPVAACAEALLAHLSLLFIPVGVGVMTHLALLQQSGLRLMAVIVLSTWAGLGVSAWTLHALRDREGADA
ncbi:CidA/LrgA family protein [Xylophilus sp. GOD-11R]|uniref:CidA/LrgA family protein n=1 Tax=Xylophilus sp. GOD-11R TaxID=3089814 RepID=UPI00298D1D84|nr:CidA/LrgA family protein [Xylophilus sp. GOD-11R]WPB56455.1 CidA/LrgA family protein [Xylophilus sp. GOD-11R]